MFNEITSAVLENGIFIVDILILLFLIAVFYKKVLKKESALVDDFFSFIRKYYFLLAFLVVLVATLGSLFYSEIIGYPLCPLCWAQRIFIYPLVIIFGVALYYKNPGVIKYSIALSVFGLAIAIYHYISQVLQTSVCDVAPGGADCIVKYLNAYGYITFPMMAITIFMIIIILGLIKLKKI